MTAYWIAHVKVTDPSQYKKYTALAPSIIAKYQGKILARGGNFKVLETQGEEKNRHVVIEFPSFEMAQSCYESKEYQQAIRLRAPACIADVTLVEGQ